MWARAVAELKNWIPPAFWQETWISVLGFLKQNSLFSSFVSPETCGTPCSRFEDRDIRLYFSVPIEKNIPSFFLTGPLLSAAGNGVGARLQLSAVLRCSLG